MAMVAVLCIFLGLLSSATAQFVNVWTTAEDYTSEHNNGNLQGLYCDLPSSHNPYPACESNAWVAFGVNLGMDMSHCGRCLQITNTAAGGGSIKACIVDRKVADGLDLDVPGFQAIDDPSRVGTFNGHMITNADFVDC